MTFQSLGLIPPLLNALDTDINAYNQDL